MKGLKIKEILKYIEYARKNKSLKINLYFNESEKMALELLDSYLKIIILSLETNLNIYIDSLFCDKLLALCVDYEIYTSEFNKTNFEIAENILKELTKNSEEINNFEINDLMEEAIKLINIINYELYEFTNINKTVIKALLRLIEILTKIY